MTLKDFAEWVAVVGAVIAVIAGGWKLRFLLRGKRDVFVVGLNSVSPTIGQESMLNVVSQSNHPISLSDWGFIDANGMFHSFRMDWEAGILQSDEISTRGSSELASFGATFESGYACNATLVGAYAKSVTQKRPRVSFASEMPYWRRVWIRVRLLFQPHYLAWEHVIKPPPHGLV